MEEENQKLASLFLQNSKKLQQEKLQTSILFYKQFQKIKNKLITNKIFKENLLNRISQQQFNDALFDPETYQIPKNKNQQEKNEIVEKITKNRKQFAKFNYQILKNLHTKELLCKYCYNCLKEYHKPDLLKNEHNFCKPIVNKDADFAFLYYDDFTELGMDYDGGGEFMAGIHYFGKKYNFRIYIGRPWNDSEHEENYGSENPFYQLQLNDFQQNQGKMCREEFVKVNSRCYENQSDFDCEDDDRDDNSQCGQNFIRVNEIICALYQYMVDQNRI